jgi:hypothetical protein
MPNPRYLVYPDYTGEIGEPTVELLRKMEKAKSIYFTNLPAFCEKWSFDLNDLGHIEGIYLIGSHATDNEWNNDTSDLDLKLINSVAPPMWLHLYKRDVLDPELNAGKEKFRWIDLFFAREEYQVLKPRWNLKDYWFDL